MPDKDDFKGSTPERLAKALLRPIKKAAEVKEDVGDAKGNVVDKMTEQPAVMFSRTKKPSS